VLRNSGGVIACRHAQAGVKQIDNPKIVNIWDPLREVLMEAESRRSKHVEGLQNENPD